MVEKASNQKASQHDSQHSDQVSSAGPNSITIAPPVYGMDFVDYGSGGFPRQILQTKLKINQPGDEYERQADRIANQVTTKPPNRPVNEVPLHIQRYSEQSTAQTEAVSASVNQALASPGKPLEPNLRNDMEQRFGYDFSRVRIHTGNLAEQSARDVNAHAYTVGQSMVFEAGQFTPETHNGRRLIAHELTHVVQQTESDKIHPGNNIHRSGLNPFPWIVQRQLDLGVPSQTIPIELRSSANLAQMNDDALTARHDLILETLSRLTTSTAETNSLEMEAARIGVELGRRKTLATGRTFSEEAIQKMKDYFIQNARKPAKPRENPPPPPPGGWQDSCIIALNKGIKIVTDKPALPTTPETIELTMAKIAASGHSSVAREVWFEGKGGRISRGGARPEKLQSSIWDTIISLAGGDPGWSVFTMSIDDGNHSVTLTLDANDPIAPRIYWSDQWSTKGGWKEYTRSELDAEVTRLVQSWWETQAVGKKFKPVVRVWRVRASPATSSGP